MFDLFYSDPHFGHKNILKHCNRPFESIEHQTDVLIKNFLKVAREGSKVLWLGDCFFCSKTKAHSILRQLPGEHYLVKGNHDRKDRAMLQIGFKMVTQELTFHDYIDDRFFRACHYPTNEYYTKLPPLSTLAKEEFKEYDKRFQSRRPTLAPNEILLHGHVHVAPQILGNCVNISCDAWNYSPVTRAQLNELLVQNKL